jgi:hypothetical protein
MLFLRFVSVFSFQFIHFLLLSLLLIKLVFVFTFMYLSNVNSKKFVEIWRSKSKCCVPVRRYVGFGVSFTDKTLDECNGRS